MVSKTTTLLVVIIVAVAGIGLTAAYHDGLFTPDNGKQVLTPPTSPTNQNNTTSQSNGTSSNNSIPNNVFVNQVQTYFTVSDSQGVYVNFTETFSGFKMLAGNATHVKVNIKNSNFFNITLNRIKIQSNGFDLENVTPLLPISLKSYGSKNLTLQIFAQSGMKSFNGSIQVDVFCNRSTEVSVSNVSFEEIINNNLNHSESSQIVGMDGFQSVSGETTNYNFTIYNNNTYAINVTSILLKTPGFSVSSSNPQLPVVIMPNESKSFSINISISESRAGYHSSLSAVTNATSTLNITITSIKAYFEVVDFIGVPQIFQIISSNGEAGSNFTIQIALMESYSYSAEIIGFNSQTSGFTVISASTFTSPLPVCITNGEVWFYVTLHASRSMAGYSGGLTIAINDNYEYC